MNLWDAWAAADAAASKAVRADGARRDGLETWPEWSGHAAARAGPGLRGDRHLRRQRYALVNGRAGWVRGRTPSDPLGCLILAALGAGGLVLLKAVF